MREDIRHLAWGILFVSWSFTLSLSGTIQLDFFPDVAGICFFLAFPHRLRRPPGCCG